MTALPHPQMAACMQLQGTLAHNAELRSKVLDGDGHTVPVICLEIITGGPAALPVYVQWPQPPGTHAAAERLCKRLRRGAAVQVQAPLLGMHLVAANASQVMAIDTEVQTPAPTPQEPTNGELFL